MVKKITTSIVDVAKESKNKINSKYQEYKNSSNANSYDELSKELPKNYEPILNAKETQKAIWEIKNYMEQELSKELNLMRVECPLIVDEKGNVNDMLDRDGSRTPVAFKINNDGKNIINAQVLQAATKWKRLALSQFEIKENEGIYTDMRAIRKDYFLDLSHSAYVAQWDWEVNIGEEKNRNINYLFNIVQTLWKIIKNCEIFIHKKYPKLTLSQNYSLPDDIFIIHSEELYKMYPNLSRKERENQILKEKGAIFICGVGYPITDENEPHENRAADYDDWITEVEWNDGSKRRGLNGDILIWNPVTQSRHELSSMGIRVNKDSLKKQLEMCKQTDLLKESYHDAIINDKVPLSIGGGIGQSRLYTYLLRKAHVGEVEVSVWPDVLKNICKENNIHLLQ